MSSALPPTATMPSGSLSEAQSDAQYQATRQALSSPGTNDLLYIGNTGNNSITVYRHDASGNTAPIKVIWGPKTGIEGPGQLSEDAQGNLYVANGRLMPSSSVGPVILVFAHGASGNVAPIRKLAGPLTGLHNVEAMTVDKTTGKIFVADLVPNGGDPYVSLLRFPPNATGNEAPFARSSPSLLPAIQLALDSSGQNIIEAHSVDCCSVVHWGINTFVKQFFNNASLTSLFDVEALAAQGVADDPTTKTYLTSTSDGIYRLAEDTVGNGPDLGPGPIPVNLRPALVSIVTSDRCGSQLAVAPGPTPNTYVLHGTQSGCPADAVYVYAHNASGNAKPLRILTGPATKMNQPYGIYEGT